MNLAWLFGGGTIEVRCDIDIEQTPESFHAHAIPDGVAIRPGDVVTVHDAPTGVGFGEHIIGVRRATVRRAGMLQRAWTELSALRELTELYEVGFQPKETTT
jgi:hypothetical protein